MPSLIDDFDETKNCENESKIKELQSGGERCATRSIGELEPAELESLDHSPHRQGVTKSNGKDA